MVHRGSSFTAASSHRNRRMLGMWSLILCLIVNGLAIVGVHFVTGQGQLLSAAAGALRAKLGPFWSKPVMDCRPCQASLWGTAFFWSAGWALLHVELWVRFLLYPWYTLSLAGLMVLTPKPHD
jgi:hypothetical protein